MPRWKALPEELDPEVEEFADALRMLVDRGGLGIAAVTGRSVTVGEALLEVRFSEVCGAAWARVTGAAAGDRVTVSAGGGPARGAEVGRDPDACTPMVAGRSAEDVKACVTPVRSRPVCTR
ncbi:DUF2690 domain-containing protein [Streptomyces chilikensis]|uniref:DUF2690 domain-containing protein n=1 Tax=Streptomyces chilikensis TaxID=1194079 RepID=A0ABV3EWF2_9ACTN